MDGASPLDFRQDLKRKTVSLKRLRQLIDHNDDLLRRSSLVEKKNLVDFADELHSHEENGSELCDDDTSSEDPVARYRRKWRSAPCHSYGRVENDAPVSHVTEFSKDDDDDPTCQRPHVKMKKRKKKNMKNTKTRTTPKSVTPISPPKFSRKRTIRTSAVKPSTSTKPSSRKSEIRSNIRAMWGELRKLRTQSTPNKSDFRRMKGMEKDLKQLEGQCHVKRESQVSSSSSEYEQRRFSSTSSSSRGRRSSLSSIPFSTSHFEHDRSQDSMVERQYISNQTRMKVDRVDKLLKNLSFDFRQLRVQVEKVKVEQSESKDMRKTIRSQQRSIDDLSSTVRAIRTKQHALTTQVQKSQKDHETLANIVDHIEQKLAPHADRMKAFSSRVNELSKKQEELADMSELMGEQFKLVLLKSSRQSPFIQYTEPEEPQQQRQQPHPQRRRLSTSSLQNVRSNESLTNSSQGGSSNGQRVSLDVGGVRDGSDRFHVNAKYEKLKRAYYRVFQNDQSIK